MLAQSAGGTGGNGNNAFGIFQSRGGSGLTGGDGGSVGLTGTGGSIATAGDGASALLAQSIGGGGGAGGNALAVSTGESVALGGNGGKGGDGRGVTVTLADTLATTGGEAAAVIAQSIGGAGGHAGSATAATIGPDPLVLAIGGDAEGGGTAGAVAVTSSGAVATRGSQSTGIAAQSVGGGGGTGGAAISANASMISIATAMRGIGGSGGDGGTVSLSSRNQVTTAGSDAHGLKAQSIGGGGGEGGVSTAFALGLSPVAGLGSVAVGVSIGGSGGAGGTVDVQNQAALRTTGADAAAVVAQSVGGGGGSGGKAASATGGATDPFDAESAFLNRLKAGLGLGAGTTTIIDGVTLIGDGVLGAYTDPGDLALLTADLTERLGAEDDPGTATGLNLAVGIGGQGGAASDGGTVTVENTGQIATTGALSEGLFAQSVGGGGGIGGGASASDIDPTSFATVMQMNVGAAGSGGQVGSGGAVTVTQGAGAGIQTTGMAAHGLVAQSIGGGGGRGGIAAAGSAGGLQAATLTLGGRDGVTGQGGAVTVNTDVSAILTTAGDYAIGILAQSVGGGGGIAGDTAASADVMAFAFASGSVPFGDGFAVNVTLTGSTLVTEGANAPVIFAQSIGGGGGAITTAAGAYAGAIGGAGVGGPVTIDIGTDGSANTLTAKGRGSPVVKAQIDGLLQRYLSDNQVNVTVGAQSRLIGGADAAAVLVLGGAGGQISNAGLIDGRNGQAISVVNSGVGVTNQATGTIYGGIAIGSSKLVNRGTLYADTTLAAGDVQNAGDLHIGVDDNQTTTTEITGTFENTGTLHYDWDNFDMDLLKVDGAATIGGAIHVMRHDMVTGMWFNAVEADTLTLQGFTGVTDDSVILGFDYQLVGNILQFRAYGGLNDAAHGLDAVQQGVADHLQAIWDLAQGAAMGAELGRLADAAPDAASYRRALDRLAGWSLGMIGASRPAAARDFAAAMQSCPERDPATLYLRERDCSWGLIRSGEATREADGPCTGFTDRASTVQLGGQRQTDGGWFLGGSLAYEDSRLAAAGGAGSATGQSVLAGLMAKQEVGAWTLSAGVLAGQGWYDSQRSLTLGGVGQTLAASPRTQQLGLYGRVAWQQPFAQSYLKAYVDLGATWLRTGGYTERGADGFALSVAAEEDLRLSAAPMVELGGLFDRSGGRVLKPYAALGAVFTDDGDWRTRAHFTGAPSGSGSFSTTTDLPETAAQIRAGVELTASDRLQLRLEYQGQFASGLDSQTGSLKLNLSF